VYETKNPNKKPHNFTRTQSHPHRLITGRYGLPHLIHQRPKFPSHICYCISLFECWFICYISIYMDYMSYIHHHYRSVGLTIFFFFFVCKATTKKKSSRISIYFCVCVCHFLICLDHILHKKYITWNILYFYHVLSFACHALYLPLIKNNTKKITLRVCVSYVVALSTVPTHAKYPPFDTNTHIHPPSFEFFFYLVRGWILCTSCVPISRTKIYVCYLLLPTDAHPHICTISREFTPTTRVFLAPLRHAFFDLFLWVLCKL